VIVTESEMLIPGRATVLLLEKNPRGVHSVKTALYDAGYSVVEALDSDDALGLLESLPEIAALVTEVDAPGSLSGLVLARIAREVSPRLGLVLLPRLADLSGHVVPGYIHVVSGLHRSFAVVEAVNRAIAPRIGKFAMPAGRPGHAPAHVWG
jgi:CheY-like chemotaxis protein